MLADNNMEFTINVPDPPARTWNDVTRSTEPAWRSNRPQYSGRWDYFDFSSVYEEMRRQAEQARSYDTEAPKYQPFTEGAWARPKPGPSSNFTGDVRELKCRTCQGTFKTKFVGAPEMYECNDCQWTAYQKKKGEAHGKSNIPDF